MDTPASTSGVRNASSSFGLSAILASKSLPFHWENRKSTGNYGPTAAWTAAAISADSRTRPAMSPP